MSEEFRGDVRGDSLGMTSGESRDGVRGAWGSVMTSIPAGTPSPCRQCPADTSSTDYEIEAIVRNHRPPTTHPPQAAPTPSLLLAL